MRISAVEGVAIPDKGIHAVYALELTGNKFYIGYSANIRNRLKNHWSGKGAKWTKLHSPIRLLEVHITESKEKAKQKERALTLSYMKRLGTHKVRGGAYCQCILPGAV